MNLNSKMFLNENEIFSIRMHSNLETINEKNHEFRNDFANIQFFEDIIFCAQNNSTNKDLMIVVKTKIQNKLIKIEIFINRNSFKILKKSFHFVKKKTINKIFKKTIQKID